MERLKFGVFDHLDRGGRTLADLYSERLQIVEQYDRAGFYAYHVAEHHCTPLGMAPSPGVFLSAVAQRTKRLRFGPLVYLLPLYHPVRLAEEIAMLDQLSHGRLEVGVGRGRSPIELMLYGQDIAQAQDVFDEALAILQLALSQGRITFSGKHFKLHDVPLELRPLQRPHPALWYGVGTPDNAEELGERAFMWSRWPNPRSRQKSPGGFIRARLAADVGICTWGSAGSSLQPRRTARRKPWHAAPTRSGMRAFSICSGATVRSRCRSGRTSSRKWLPPA
jgi:alkanesulfonate monooxygenase SsuD/methylene tetrahydromethanopterin reductase-like flavin-dependent oxidoreductase (luciferase family)